MSGKLIDLPTNLLLQKFGAGDHKPGSGSAAALQGMLSAKLLITVIDLTSGEKRRKSYASSLPELKKIADDIEVRIYPVLEKIFQDDSDQFDKTIKLRKARDNERDQPKRKKLVNAALDELKVATETPVEIAKLCIQLADFAVVVFDKGFRSARGDVGVAHNGAIAAVAGCMSIINLNLLSFAPSSWKVQIRTTVGEIREKYEDLLEEAKKLGDRLIAEVTARNDFQNEIEVVLSSIEAESKLTNDSIERTAKNFQNLLWKHQKVIWRKSILNDPLEVLSPEQALRSVLGFEFFLEKALGTYQSEDGLIEVAGIIDSVNKIVRVSKAFEKETQNFTAAHELGHALFHKDAILHRDKPMDGSSTVKDKKEQQADKFAAFFLLPEKQVRRVFKELFKTEKLFRNEETAFALTSGSVIAFRKKYRSVRDFGRFVSATNYYAGESFKSMAEIFQVSVETMAIRLEELALVGI